MKPLTTAQLYIGGIALFAAFCFASDSDFHNKELFVDPHIAQGFADELNKPRETLNRLQEDWDTRLALQEVK